MLAFYAAAAWGCSCIAAPFFDLNVSPGRPTTRPNARSPAQVWAMPRLLLTEEDTDADADERWRSGSLRFRPVAGGRPIAAVSETSWTVDGFKFTIVRPASPLDVGTWYLEARARAGVAVERRPRWEWFGEAIEVADRPASTLPSEQSISARWEHHDVAIHTSCSHAAMMLHVRTATEDDGSLVTWVVWDQAHDDLAGPWAVASGTAGGFDFGSTHSCDYPYERVERDNYELPGRLFIEAFDEGGARTGTWQIELERGEIPHYWAPPSRTP